jgi:hypothetical protein
MAQAVPATQINDFETVGEQGQVTPTPPVTKVIPSIVSSPTVGVSHGTKALKLKFKVGGGSYPTAEITLPAAQDWTGSGALAMDIHNPGATDVTFYLRLDDSTSADYMTWINTVKAGQTLTVQQSLITNTEIAAISDQYGYQKIPWVGLGDDRAVYVADTTPPNRASINKLGFQLQTAPVGADVDLIIDNLHLVPGPKLDSAAYGDSIVNSFETPTETARVISSPLPTGISSITYQTTPGGGMTLHGTKVMKVVWAANSGVSYPGVRLTPPDAPADWLGMPGAGIALNVYNPGATSIPLALQLKDDAGGTRFSYFSVPAATSGKWVMPFFARAGLNMASVTDMSTSGSPGSVDLQHISEIKLYYNSATAPTSAVTAYFDHFRVKTGNTHIGMLDKYGQYTRLDWPGKVYYDSDLTAALSTEDADLTAYPTKANRDIYGGWTAAGVGATGLGSGNGYFRTWYDTTKSTWWLVDPLGNKFFSTGTNCIISDLDKILLTANAPGTLDRTSWFQTGALPVDGSADPLAQFYTDVTTGQVPFDNGGRAYKMYEANVYRKYFPSEGANWYNKWKTDQERRLKSWGFNTVAAWSNSVAGDINVPFVIAVTSLHGSHPYNRITVPYQAHGPMPDPWDTRGQGTTGLFRSSRANLGQAAAGDHRTNPYLIGYMIDNEMSWGIESSVDFERYSIAWGVLMINTTAAGQSPAKDVFIADMAAKYASVAALNTAWGTSFTGANVTAALRPAYNPSPSNRALHNLTAEAETDYGNFISKYSDKYFDEVSAAVDDYDTNHLYLGCRFAMYTRRTVKEAAKYVDVISFNYYRFFDGADWAWLADTSIVPTQKPAMITEFSFGAMDRGLFGPTVSGHPDTQAERALDMDTYFTNVATTKHFVGAHWFQHIDQPLLGRNQDGETGNYGIVMHTDIPHPEMVAQLRMTHSHIYPDHHY